MTLHIKKVTKKDLPQISELYDGRKSINELAWLFRDPNAPQNFNAYVALEDQNKIVGVIGYVESVYQLDKKSFKGVIMMSWMTSQNHRGLAGVLLLKKVLETNGFGLAIGGTKTALNLYPMFKYIEVAKRYTFIKTLKPFKYFFSHPRFFVSGIYNMIRSFPGYSRNLKKKSYYNDVRLTNYNRNNLVKEKDLGKVLHKKISNNYINWLLDCPKVASYAYLIHKNKIEIGICIFYIKQKVNYKMGRIVYLPHFGADIKLWNSVLKSAINFFKDNNCQAIDAVATNEINICCLKRFGFIESRNSPKSIFIRDNRGDLKDINITNMHMQYTEGDKAYLSL